MKLTLSGLILSLIVHIAASQQIQRRVRFQNFGNDSIGISLNDEYYLIEDSCAQITRHGHFDFARRKFYGKFTDVSKANPNMIVSEGTYSTDGLKDGEFKSYYLNGQLQAKGRFKNNKYEGRWEMYYNDGKPELVFDAADGVYTILDAWQPDGTKTVDNGNGVFTDNLGGLYWKGKLVNGKPDGKWRLLKTDDISGIPIGSESFKKGQFREGSLNNNDYNDASHLTLVSLFKLPFVNAEKMFISPVPCNGAKRKHIINAQYENGLESFSSHISDAVKPYFSRVNLTMYGDIAFQIDGEISEKGQLVNLKSNGSDLARGVIRELMNLPVLHPATVDGKPVKQKFTITFKIGGGFYQFNYRFSPVHAE